MNQELLAILEYLERERKVPRERLIRAIEESLMAAARKAVGPARHLRCSIDPKTGEVRAYARLIVAERVVSRHDQISLSQARQIKPDAQVGDEVEVEVTPANFGRIAAQHTRQVLLNHLRRVEQERILQEFKGRVGDIVRGTIRGFEKGNIVVYLDEEQVEAILPQEERVPTEKYQKNDKIRAYIKAVEHTKRGPVITLSRADPRFIIRLFQLEVAEVADGTIEIKAIAREPGHRTKIAVYSHDPRVDPVGACVGIRGTRVRNIVRELNEEKIDVVEWSPDIAEFVAKALSPAVPIRVEVDEEAHRVRAIVPRQQLPQAIGKRGQNARLATILTGWQVEIQPEEEHVPAFEEQVEQAIENLAQIPGITRQQADILVHHGFLTLQQLLESEEEDLAAVPGIGDQAAQILQAARDEAQRRMIVIHPPGKEEGEEAEPASTQQPDKSETASSESSSSASS